MTPIGDPERVTQNRVIALFRDDLKYAYLGAWTDRENNSNIEEALLAAYLKRVGYSAEKINRAIYLLRAEADRTDRALYDNNKAVYRMLRYGVDVKTEASQPNDVVKLINWDQPEGNDFAIAEEVTLRGNLERRPDIVLYVNGIAVGVLELKRSSVSVAEGIRQNLSNQKPEFNAWFFSTVQCVFAGNDTEGLRYGAIGTPEKYFLTWKEDEDDNRLHKLDKYLQRMCRPDRLIELMHDFVLFDGGVKKLPRVHQYFGIKAAQQHANAYRGGIIWHTQGSGKSIVMVLLAKWILETKPNARVLIVTDRDELDKQIEGVFTEAGVPITRTSSGHDLMNLLGQPKPRLLCSLIHKFGPRDVDDFEAFIKALAAEPPRTVGELFVFVDECHRTQSGKLHRAMQGVLPGAVFIGFTGTPLLKQDRKTTRETFGDYIHTYKFSEGVADGVVLDLVYESRDIEQTLGSQHKIDAWFDAKTRGLNEWQRAALREQWGTMQQVLSSRSRMERVLEDIIFDFSVKPRLSSHRGNAILVASSIHEACRYYELFQKTPFKGKCAVVTSYNPQAKDVTLEETGANTETDKQFIFNTYNELLKNVAPRPGKSKTETYEDDAKRLFTKQPANMRLLIVVDKLLTGFDAPSCTFLYIDKSMQDHGLFQAICRVNRLDGDDKTVGYIVDYKDLFPKVESAIAVYTSELDDSAGGAPPDVLMHDRLEKGRERLEAAREAMALLCEPVAPPKGELEHIHYFCGNTEVAEDLAERQDKRVALYQATVALVRAYAGLAGELEAAKYNPAEVERIKADVERAVKLREIIRHASGETIDLKAYEADMRHLIDTYIEAEEPRRVSPFGEMPLLDIIAKAGIASAIAALPPGIRAHQNAVAETIANNVRRRIMAEHLTDPAYYERMSKLLEEILADLRAKRSEYEQYLARIADLAKQVQRGFSDSMSSLLSTAGMRALFNNLAAPARRVRETPGGEVAGDDARIQLAVKIDQTVKQVRPDAWRGHQAKENEIKRALLPLLNNDVAEVERMFAIIVRQPEY